MTFLYLALYAMLILAATIASDKSRLLVNELRWRLCRFWHTQLKSPKGRRSALAAEPAKVSGVDE